MILLSRSYCDLYLYMNIKKDGRTDRHTVSDSNFTLYFSPLLGHDQMLITDDLLHILTWKYGRTDRQTDRWSQPVGQATGTGTNFVGQTNGQWMYEPRHKEECELRRMSEGPRKNNQGHERMIVWLLLFHERNQNKTNKTQTLYNGMTECRRLVTRQSR